MVSNVSKKYPSQEKNAVDGVSLCLGKGEILSVVGENGSGKTTLLRLIAGLEDADGGEIYLQQQKITGPAYNLVPGHKNIKMLAQDLALFPKHTVFENISYNLRSYHEEFQMERMAELLEQFFLEDMKKKRPQELSGGQQQRVALARTLAEKSPVLLLDEPFSNLDVMLKDMVKKSVIRQARADGTTCLLVLHDIKDALQLSDTIAVMREGKIIQVDTPENLYERPRNEYVAYLCGRVNILSLKQLLGVFPDLEKEKDFKTQKDVKVCLRPEHLTLCNKNEEMASGTVRHASYLGDSWELEVAVGEVLLIVSSPVKISQGAEVGICIRNSKIHVMH